MRDSLTSSSRALPDDLVPPNANPVWQLAVKATSHGQRIATLAVAHLALFILLPLLLAAQTAPPVSMEDEPHHRLVLKNDVLKVYAVDVASHDALAMHRHDHDDIAFVLGDATTVSTSPGEADLLRISKPGEVRFAPGPRNHSLRNIGQGPYRLVTIELLRKQSGAHNLCGKQIANSPPNCQSAADVDANAPRNDVPQFETDQTRVTSSRLRANRQAAFGDSDRDELIVLGGGAAISPAPGKGPDQSLPPGEAVWIPRGKTKRTIKNNNDADLSIVVVAIKP
jgi:quercetin dioxygenase-like cupin family protein